jgi:hypothetical protein
MCRMGMGGCIDKGRMGSVRLWETLGRFCKGEGFAETRREFIGLDLVMGKSLTRHLVL